MLESTFSKACDDLKNGKVLNADTPEKAAKYVLKEIENNLTLRTGLPNDSPEPWAPMDDFERWKEIALWSIEKQFPAAVSKAKFGSWQDR